MQLTLGLQTVPGTYLGTQTYTPSDDPLPTPDVPNDDDPIPTPTPLPNSNSTTTESSGIDLDESQVAWITIECILAAVLIIMILDMSIRKGLCPCCRKTPQSYDTASEHRETTIVSGQPQYDRNDSYASTGSGRATNMHGSPLIQQKEIRNTLTNN